MRSSLKPQIDKEGCHDSKAYLPCGRASDLTMRTLPANLPAHPGVRACAALSVMLYHFTLDAGEDWYGWARLFQHGYFGVDLFFVLSGFIIHHVYKDFFERTNFRTKYARFLKFRLAR